MSNGAIGNGAEEATTAAPVFHMRSQGGRTVVSGTNTSHTAPGSIRFNSEFSVSRETAQTSSASVTIRMDLVKQSVEGIGFSNAFYTNWWQSHPKKAEIFGLMFRQLQPTILRLRNSYQLEDMSSSEMQIDAEFIQTAKIMLGYTPKILLTAWTPPASMKVSGTLKGATDSLGNITATLSKDGNGWFRYRDLALHWANSLVAYAKLSIFPDFISPQNEPDYNASAHQTCYFREVESFEYAGYYRAAQEVYDTIVSDKRITKVPQMIGPESFGFDTCIGQFPIGGGGRFHAIANHLYASGDATAPNSFNPALSSTSQIARSLGIQNIWMSEFAKLSKFESQDPLNLAILMHNAFTIGNVTAYLHWDAAWAAGTPDNEGTMILVENPYADPKTWTNPAGYTILKNFWWFKHFSNCIRPGYRRVQCDIAIETVLVNAWTGPYGEFATILINTGTTQQTITLLNLPSWVPRQATDIYFSTLYQDYTYAGTFYGNSVTLPPKSITSIFSYNKPARS